MGQGRLRLFQRFRRMKIYKRGAHKTIPKRLNWEQIETVTRKERRNVVKGTSKRIVVVRSPDPKVFEQAIFIVKEDFLGRGRQVDALKEAQRVANDYIRGTFSLSKRRVIRIPAPVWGLIGAAVCVAAFLFFHLL